MATVGNGGLVILEDVFTEDTDGQALTVTLSNGVAVIDTDSITEIRATLRTIDTSADIFVDQDVTPVTGTRGSYVGAAADGTYRITFTAADMVTNGTAERQTRELTLYITHSAGKKWRCAIRFFLRNLSAVPAS